MHATNCVSCAQAGEVPRVWTSHAATAGFTGNGKSSKISILSQSDATKHRHVPGPPGVPPNCDHGHSRLQRISPQRTTFIGIIAATRIRDAQGFMSFPKFLDQTPRLRNSRSGLRRNVRSWMAAYSGSPKNTRYLENIQLLNGHTSLIWTTLCSTLMDAPYSALTTFLHLTSFFAASDVTTTTTARMQMTRRSNIVTVGLLLLRLHASLA
jgi:hypothetical protein